MRPGFEGSARQSSGQETISALTNLFRKECQGCNETRKPSSPAPHIQSSETIVNSPHDSPDWRLRLVIENAAGEFFEADRIVEWIRSRQRENAGFRPRESPEAIIIPLSGLASSKGNSTLQPKVWLKLQILTI